ncbi:MAG: FtsX-like permease family protein [Oscillospiraceae bacterium]|jgi:putative ABC transport system permease protein|nr:FtsX-like permease family protein [Oscillospiraceae bacterium]
MKKTNKKLKTAMIKDIYRLVFKSLRRFFAILLITAVGVAFFVGLRSTGPDMQHTVEEYFKQNNASDVKLLSTLGFDDGDIAALQKIPAVKQLELGHFADVYIDNGKTTNLVKALSFDMNKLQDENSDMLNRPVLVAGRLPQKPNECLIDEQMTDSIIINSESNAFSLGDTITLLNEDGTAQEDFARTEFVITGYVRHLEYISFERSTTTVGKGTLDGFVMLPQENFLQEFYTQIYVDVDTKSNLLFSDEYNSEINSFGDAVEAAGDARNPIRFAQLISDSNTKIADAKAEVEKGEHELADAKKQLDDAKTQLDDGQEKIENGRAELQEAYQKLIDGQAQLTQARQEIIDGDAQLKAGKAELAAQQEKYNTEIAAAQTKLNDSKAQLDNSKTMLDAQQGQYDTNAAALQTAQEQLEQSKPLLPPELYEQKKQELNAQAQALATAKTQLDAGWQQYNNGVSEYEKGLAEFTKKRDDGKKQLDDAAAEIAANEQKLEEGKKTLNSSELELIDGREKYESGKNELETQESKLAEAKTKYEDALGKYNKNLPGAEEKIAEANEEIAKAQTDLQDLDEATWYTVDWRKNPGFEGYRQNCNRISAIANLFPLIFFLVAALVSLTIMTRLVEENRTNIGLYKALGYRRQSIAAKYLVYAGAATLVGTVGGVIFGTTFFPAVIYNAYRIMYSLPNPLLPVNWAISLWACAAAFAAAVIPAYLVCQSELRGQPASLMRPKAPKLGKKIFLEKIGFIWKRLKFSHKVMFRNVFRYKKRFFMTVLGIAGSTALLLTGFGLRDSITDIIPNQFGRIHTYSTIVQEKSDALPYEIEGIKNKLNANQNVERILPAHMENVDVESPDKTYTAKVIVPLGDSFEKFYNLNVRETGEHIPLEDGTVILTEKLMKNLQVTPGEKVVFYDGDHRKYTATAGQAAENYYSNYMFMTQNTYRQIYGNMPAESSIILQLADTSPTAVDDFTRLMLQTDGVTEVVDNTAIVDNFDSMLSSLDSVVYVLISSAAFLLAIVMFSLININLDERRKEIATLKVMGFKPWESCMYLYRENIVLTVIGTLCGLGIGYFLCMFIIQTSEVDEVMFGRVIHVATYFIATALTFAFSLIINLFTIRLINKIDMVESMKSVE